jgi:predicted dehydrogenase
MKPFRKLLRSAWLYGPGRAAVKAISRLGWPVRLTLPGLGRRTRTGLLGCGQFGFATICYYLAPKVRFTRCFDPDATRARLAQRCWGFGEAGTPEAVIDDDQADIVYIASNHATHAGYAIAALDAGKRVYVEKPVATTFEQLAALIAAERRNPNRLFVGYNRPHARAVRELVPLLRADLPVTLSCTIVGHLLAADHWYRGPAEGTRICGNVGHWLDLAIHLLGPDRPDRWRLTLAAADERERDENVAICLTSSRGDLISIVLTARSEPFEGIHESILVQQGEVSARIDDFRAMTLWKGPSRTRRRYWPKDVGHRRAIRQPLLPHALQPDRWQEVIASSLLMLEIAEMVRAGDDRRDFSFADQVRRAGASSG